MPIDGLDDDIRAYAQEVLELAANALLDDLVADAPFDTGELVQSAFGPEIDPDNLTATIGFMAPQADWTNEGVAPHDIYPVNAPALTFFWENGPDGPGVYSFQHVSHPGQEATGWFDDAVDRWDDYVEDAVT